MRSGRTPQRTRRRGRASVPARDRRATVEDHGDHGDEARGGGREPQREPEPCAVRPSRQPTQPVGAAARDRTSDELARSNRGWHQADHPSLPTLIQCGEERRGVADRTIAVPARTPGRREARWEGRGGSARVAVMKTMIKRRHAAPASSAPAIALRDVRKVHGEGDGAVVALDGISVELPRGSFTAIMGPSGSGKSTFLHVAAGLDHPTSGTVALGDTPLAGLSERRLTILRRERVGFIFQAFNLMPSLTVTQNIGLPLRLDGRRPRRADVREVAARVGLDQRLGHRPSQLSGGQQQRVAIARALITRPEVVFADEPTGALDTKTGRGVLALLREVVDADGHTVVMVTHDPQAAAHADRVILLADGRIAGTLEAPDADEVAEQLAHLGD